jgi:CheY-like chemotaxis protein
MSEHVLVVDDDPDTADTLTKLIGQLGYEAVAAYDGESAIQVAASFLPDMALIDLGMPGLDGLETVKRLRQLRTSHHVILVAVTGWTRDEDKKRALEAGFDLHVAKPMSLDTLKQVLALLDPAAGAG